MRRKRGSGSIYRRASDSRWVVSRSVGFAEDGARKRTTITSLRLCEALKRMSALEVAANVRETTGRYDAMQEARRKGTHTEAEWVAYRAAVGRCEYCGWKPATPNVLTMDHRTPVTRGGSDALGNLAAACAACNGMKGTMTEDEWRQFMADTPWHTPRHQPIRRPRKRMCRIPAQVSGVTCGLPTGHGGWHRAKGREVFWLDGVYRMSVEEWEGMPSAS